YYFINKDKDSGPAVVNQQAADACNDKFKDKDFCKFAANWTNATSYTATMRSTFQGQASTVTLRNDGKGNSHSISEGAGQPATESITLDGTLYTKTAGADTWFKFPNNDSDTDEEES